MDLADSVVLAATPSEVSWTTRRRGSELYSRARTRQSPLVGDLSGDDGWAGLRSGRYAAAVYYPVHFEALYLWVSVGRPRQGRHPAKNWRGAEWRYIQFH